MTKRSKILNEVCNYYEDKLQKFGVTSKGVDWNSEESQLLRFRQLSYLLNQNSSFSLLDYGCGYGRLFSYLEEEGYSGFEYAGYDISKSMVATSQENFKQNSNAEWINNLRDLKLKTVDYVIASGVFNVRLENNSDDWESFILNTLHEFDRLGQMGFSFNLLSTYSDIEHRKDYLYYVDPTYIFDYCKTNFSKYVTLLHDYPLYEFTIIVKK